jgi:hypothetical protein
MIFRLLSCAWCISEIIIKWLNFNFAFDTVKSKNERALDGQASGWHEKYIHISSMLTNSTYIILT